MADHQVVSVRYLVDGLEAEVARLSVERRSFRNAAVSGPARSQVLALDPSGNLVEVFQPVAG
jgi:hypothetical protein